MEWPGDLTIRSAAGATVLAGLGLFAAPFLTRASEAATTLEASFAALVIVLGYDLFVAARREPALRTRRAGKTAQVIETTAAAYLAVALVDWLLHSVADVAAALGMLALAAAATGCARAAALRLTRRSGD